VDLDVNVPEEAAGAAMGVKNVYDHDYYYGAAYQDYDLQNPSAKLAFYRTVALSSVQEMTNVRVLDIGCAFGRFLHTLPPSWVRVGVDVSAYAIEIAKRNIPGVSFQQGDLPSADLAAFDVITAFDVIEHIGEVGPMLDRIESLLAPGGVFTFVVPVYDGPLGWIVRWLDYDPTHVNKWSRKAWMTVVSERFDVVDSLGIFRYLFPGGVYAHIPTVWLRNVSPAVLITVRKRHKAVR
jgi:SAM-dependent methyltransferase